MCVETDQSSAASVSPESIVVLGGEYDISRVDELRAVLRDGPPTPCLVIEMSEVSFMDSSALGVFVEVRLEIEATGGRVVVRNLRPAQLRLFEMTGMTGFFGIE